jgi:hypothetical protein
MEAKHYDLLQRIVMETAGTLQNKPPIRAEEWQEVYDELVRASKIIEEEIEDLDA